MRVWTDIPEWALRVRSLVVFSGAGISTDSGIQDFRGPAGVWTLNPGGERKHTYQAFMTDPELRGRYWKSRAESPVWNADPNAGHLAVASLAGSDIDTTVVTQNTDGLHQRAGTPADRVIELHGTMHETICVECGGRSATAGVLARIAAGEVTPPCLRCGGIMKTASTMFGQTMPPAVFDRARRAVTTCDLLLAAGTTLIVEPAGSLCASAVRSGATLVIVNWDPTPYDGIAAAIIRDPLSEALPQIIAQLRAAGTRSGARPVPGRPAADTASPSVPRPSQLLRAQARTARLRSRAPELERLTAWCTGSGSRAHLVSGPAGIGKSRLALELADRLAATGERDVEFLAPGAHLPATRRPLLVVIDDAETRQEQVARILQAVSARPAGGSVRVLLLARRQDGWWERLRSETDTGEELGALDGMRSGHAEAVRDAAHDYAAALTAAGYPCPQPGRAFLARFSDGPYLPGALQASVLTGLLSETGRGDGTLAGHELACLQRASDEYGLGLPADVVASAAATAILCGAADEEAAVAALGHLPALDVTGRVLVAQWLREEYPPVSSGQSAYLDESLPDPLAEDLIAATATPRFLLRTLTETTQEQDRRALTVLARAADTRPALRVCLTDLLSLLPGLSPAAVDAALASGYPAPLADALTSLARNVALPAELLDLLPAGTTVLGEFPVALAESLVEAYEQREKTENGLRGLTRTLIELADRLADLGRAEQAITIARRSAETAGRLAGQAGYPARAAESLRRATELAHRQPDQIERDL